MKNLLFVSIATVCIFSCGKKRGDEGIVSLSMTRADSTSLSLGEVETYLTPKTFAMKPLAVELSTNGSDNASHLVIWANKACQPSEGKTTLDKKEYVYYDAFTCDASADNKEVDLTDQTAVNAEFNSQTWGVVPQTYYYATILMCTTTTTTNGTKVDNLRFNHAEMAAEKSFMVCDNYRTKLVDAGIAIGEGESVKLDVTYDMTKFIKKTVAEMPLGEDTNCALSSDKLTTHCANIGADALTLSVKK